MVGGSNPVASPWAALGFAALLIAVAIASGCRWRRPAAVTVIAGVAGGAALVGASLLGLPSVTLGPRAGLTVLLWWAPLAALVATAEELTLRGALFQMLEESQGPISAVLLTSLGFALIHLPLYGPNAFLLDLCAGAVLGALRLATGDVAAPLVAHVIADLAAGWIG